MPRGFPKSGKNHGTKSMSNDTIMLKRGLDKPVYFCTITNQGVYKYLNKAGIGVVDYEKKNKPIFYTVETTVGYVLKNIKKI